MSRTAPVTVFATEPTAIQLSWSSFWSGPHRLSAGPASVDVHGVGPCAPVLDGLAPGTRYDIALDDKVVASATTLTPPAGRLVAKVATISDLHIGERHWGHLPRIHDDRPGVPLPPSRCLAAVLEEITAWGPDVLVAKGDLTHECHQVEFDEVGAALKDLPFPVLVIPGNHDGGNHQDADVVEGLGAWGIDAVVEVTHLDLPGLRIVALPTVVAGTGWAAGLTPARLDLLADTLRAAPGPVLLCTHHQPVRRRVLTYWPPGILHADARRVLTTVRAANPATLVTAGHTHRNRRWTSGGVPITEVGSIKDYPGTWGGYYVYEQGIVQALRRVQGREAIAWTERGRRMLFGVWGRYAPGVLTDRCFSHTWPAR